MKNDTILELKLPKTISLNSLYAGKHWTFRKKTKDEYKKIIEAELDNFDKCRFDTFKIVIKYHYNQDIDNVVLVSKFVSDTLVANDWVNDDNPKHYKGLKIVYDKSVEKNHCQVIIYGEGVSEM
jgi:hypothetical protein